jgi:tRNA-binding protein
VTPAKAKPTISPELLNQIDIRVGTIESVIKRERANPREIEDKQALFVVNLPPRKMAGVMSEAMLFDIGYADGITPVLAVPESRVPNGTRAG